MLEQIWNSNVVYIVMLAIFGIGVVTKLIVSVSLHGLVKSAQDMSKSNHRFMRLVRAKFEHACMVNNKVENIPVFVDKHIREYQLLGIRLQGWRRLERAWAILAGVLSIATVAFVYYYMQLPEAAFRYAAIGGGSAVILMGIFVLSDEKYKIETLATYMVDYLQNTCAHRYAKAVVRNRKMTTVSTREENYGGVGEDPTVIQPEQEKLGREKVGREKVGLDKFEAEKFKADEFEVEKFEAMKQGVEKFEEEKREVERLEVQRVEAERLEAQKLGAEKLEKERLEAEKRKAERLETERLEAQRVEAEKLEMERLEAEKLEAKRLEEQKLEESRRAEEERRNKPEAKMIDKIIKENPWINEIEGKKTEDVPNKVVIREILQEFLA